jgi:hypothetical protein
MAVFILGALITSLVVIQLVLLIWHSVQAVVLQRERHRCSLELFEQRIEAARALRAKNEKARFAWNGYRKFVVDRKVEEAEGLCSFYLVPHDRKPLPAFLPGQFLTFSLDIPGQDKPVIRCYSLSDAPHDDVYRITVKRLPPPSHADAPPGLVSNYLHEQCNEGDILDVKAPGGKFVLDPRARKPAVLIGGGVGVTPFLSMLNSVIDTASSREVWLFYGIGHGGEHVMKNHLRGMDARTDNINVVICYSQPRDDDVDGDDFDHEGYVSVELLKQYFSTNNYEFYVCGPPPMMSALTQQLSKWGVPKSDIRTEAFGPASVKAQKSVSLPSVSPSRSPNEAECTACSVSFAKLKKEIPWDGASDNLLEFAEANNVALEGGCRAGNCGTCEVAVLSGEIEYNQEPEFPDLEDGCCLTCIGVPKGDVVLDA